MSSTPAVERAPASAVCKTDPAARIALLAATANDLIMHSEPGEFLGRLFERLDEYCGLEACFSYWVEGSRLRLAFATGIPDDVAKQIEHLEFGQAVCGMVAQEHRRITVEDIQSNQSPLTELVRSLGIQAYCCHPLITGGKLLGTLSFGTRSRTRFTDDEVSLMQAISDQAALAVERFLYVRQLSDNNAALQKANSEMAYVNERLKQFTYAVSHDLREPVRTVHTYAQLLSRKLGRRLAEDEQELVSVITRSASSLASFIESLLAYVRIDSTGPEQRRPTDSNAIVGDALLACKVLLDDARADMEVAVLPRTVLADRTQIVQVFQNLFSNAVKYRRDEEAPVIRVSATVANATAVFAVSDNGQGIEPEYQERVFELFTRLHGPETAGSGLGLAISKRIIEMHGGRMWVESTPGAGSTFYFTLPVSAGPVSAG